MVAQFAPHPSSATSISWKAGLTSRNSLGAAASEGPALLDTAVESSADGRERPLIFDVIDGEKSGLQTVMERLPDWRVCRAAPGVWRSRCQISCPKKAAVLGKCASSNSQSNPGKNKSENTTLHCCRHRVLAWCCCNSRRRKGSGGGGGAVRVGGWRFFNFLLLVKKNSKLLQKLRAVAGSPAARRDESHTDTH